MRQAIIAVGLMPACTVGFWASTQIARDACHDAGGSWNAQRITGLCIGLGDTAG